MHGEERFAMPDVSLPRDDSPSPEQVATAFRLRELHRRRPEPLEPICWWCLKNWPCPDEQWASRILHRGQETA
jgi:hypothetical protein